MDSGHRILLYKGTGLISWMIEKQTRSEYSHLAILLPDLTVVESIQSGANPFRPGVIRRHFYEEEEKICDRFIVDGHTPEMWGISEEYLLMHVDKKTPYDPRGVLRFVSKVPHAENGKMFCSELGYEALRLGGTKILMRTCASKVSPGMASLSTKLILDPWE